MYFGWDAFWTLFFVATMSPWCVLHAAIRPGVRAFQTWIRPWGRFTLALCGIRWRLDARADVPEPVVYVSNHQNAFDIPALSAALPTPFVFAAKKDLHSWPFVGWVLDRTDCVFIDRSGPKKALESMREAAGQIQNGVSVLLFPEGGRSWRHGLLPFMRGAFVLAIEAGVPVVPVALVGNTGVLDETAASGAAGRDPHRARRADLDAGPLAPRRQRALRPRGGVDRGRAGGLRPARRPRAPEADGA